MMMKDGDWVGLFVGTLVALIKEGVIDKVGNRVGTASDGMVGLCVKVDG